MMIGTLSEIFAGFSYSHSLISLSVIVVFACFSSINFQFPFISFAVKKLIPTVLCWRRVSCIRVEIFLSLCLICSVPSTTLARGSLAVQMNAEFVCMCVYVCVCAKCMLLFH